MRKKDTLYKANKWNKPLFMPEPEDENLFLLGGTNQNQFFSHQGGGTYGNTSYPTLGNTSTGLNTGNVVSFMNNSPALNTSNYSLPPLESYLPQGLSEDTYRNLAIGSSGQMLNAFSNYGKSIVDNFGKGNLFKTTGGPSINTKDPSVFFGKDLTLDPNKASDTAKAVKSGFKGAAMQAAGAAALNTIGAIDTGERNGLFDTLDPVHHLAGGRESAVGNAMSDTGVALTKTGNPWLMLAGAGLKIVGGLTNAAFGLKTNKQGLEAANNSIAQNKNFVSNASTFDEIKGPASMTSTNIYKGGWFSGGKARRKNQELKENMQNAYSWASRSVDNNVDNIISDQLSNLLANYSSFGGPIEAMPMFNGNNRNMGAIEYGFMSDYLGTKQKNAENKNQMTNMFMGSPSTMFDLGGDIQMNGGDFSTGLTHIDAGGSHELNPNDGVQMGVDREGTPNLVEEGETVFNDYVFSNRILADEATKKLFHLPKKKDITFADISKKLEKEISERPNDPISEAGFKTQMQTLEEQQERQKQEMEAERAKAAFEALSPEEQTAVMQQRAQQEQIAQEAAMQQEAMAQQQAQPSPEEQAMMQQQMMQADGSQAIVGQEPPMMAEGGNLFDKGGEMKKLFYKLIGVSTDSDYKAWLKKNNLDELKDAEDWENILDNKAIMSVVTKGNPALAHAIENNYDFGLYKPGTSGNISFDDDRGNWDAQTVQGWWGSNDPAWKQVIEAHPELTKDTNLTKEQLAEYLRNTDAFKRGTQWLQDSENNRLAYLQRIINNPNAPKRAKEYALRFADANGWKQNAARDYETIFNNPSGRAANPGTYWKTPIEIARGSQTGNFVINDDGTVEPIIGDVPADWTGAGNYSWATPENDYAYNYYRRPTTAADAVKTPEQKAAEEVKAKEEARRILPVHTNQLFGVEDIGPLLSMGMMAAGVGKPDTSSLYSAIRGAGNATLANWMPRGDFAVYKPDDPWFYTSPIIAQSNATQRAIENKVSPTKGAETLANSYNTMIALGQAQRQQLDSNFDKYMKVKQYNGTIYDANQKEYGQTSRFNASALNDVAGRQAQLGLTAAREAMDADAAWNQNWYGNIGALTKAMGARRKENKTRNMIADMAATGLFGTITPDTFIANGMLRYETDEERRKRLSQPSAEGSSIKRKKGKRGLTF